MHLLFNDLEAKTEYYQEWCQRLKTTSRNQKCLHTTMLNTPKETDKNLNSFLDQNMCHRYASAE